MTSLLFGLLLLSSAVQSPPASLDRRLQEPSLVDIDEGRKLNVFCLGEGSPVVLFEQGGEGNIANWKWVEPEISALTRTCFYDRAGFGYSDPPASPVTALSVTDDLHALLAAAEIKGPVVLVGHSIGGFYATVHASRFPDEVAGLVLVDPGFAGQELWRTAEDVRTDLPNIERGEQSLLDCARLGRAGELTHENLQTHRCFPVADDLPPGETRYLLYAVTGPAWYEAEHSQSVNFFSRDEDLSISQRQAEDLGRLREDLPLVVLSAGTPPSSGWRNPERTRAHAEHWHDGHRRLAERSANGRWAVVEDAGHFVQRDRPDAVSAAITDVVLRVRSQAESQ
ncbi:alpha/beta fold hydrolase [Brevundimonas viscosa]|uniref:Pimeloyl-ACP methyl ester carboxylesterase n=1 Tax=Brevundimonas viscosa TaxID=871741 RepID=A0A1I6P954_9CAUL|nr:alpha/beta hydrolase [Brevundimonas viscosa]SFS36706.1 Pimeloyl-ACP methyl ester carboxylesterase [Brevundimonas viscosa]